MENGGLRVSNSQRTGEVVGGSGETGTSVREVVCSLLSLG